MKNFATILFFCLCFIPCANAHEHNILLSATVTKNTIAGDVFIYNLSNAKLHTSNCEWAEKCTKNCIFVDKKTLKSMFFVPCIVCGGGIIEPSNAE